MFGLIPHINPFMRRYPYEWEDNKPKEECLHKQCTKCHGTGKKQNGEVCVHMISCPCKKCNPVSM